MVRRGHHIFHEIEPNIIIFFIVNKTTVMAHFDIETSKAELDTSKRRYEELLVAYAQLKSQAHPQQLFPLIEKKLYDAEQSIQAHTNMIQSYEELVGIMHSMNKQDLEMKEEIRRVRARFEN